MGNPYASTSRVHHPHFSNIQKSIPRISSFNLIVGLWKMYMFLPLNLILISIHADWQKQLLEPEQLLLKSFNSTYKSKPLKKLAFLRAFQFQLNSGTYTIIQLLSLKLPMASQWIQASSSKIISIPNVRKDFHIYLARQSATLAKMLKWCFVWQYEYGYLPLHIEIQILLQKYLFYNYWLDSCWFVVVKKRNDLISLESFSLYYSYKHNTF